MRPGRAANHSPPSSAAVMEDPLGHTGPVTGSLYLFFMFPNNLLIHLFTPNYNTKQQIVCHQLQGIKEVNFLELEDHEREWSTAKWIVSRLYARCTANCAKMLVVNTKGTYEKCFIRTIL